MDWTNLITDLVDFELEIFKNQFLTNIRWPDRNLRMKLSAKVFKNVKILFLKFQKPP